MIYIDIIHWLYWSGRNLLGENDIVPWSECVNGNHKCLICIICLFCTICFDIFILFISRLSVFSNKLYIIIWFLCSITILMYSKLRRDRSHSFLNGDRGFNYPKKVHSPKSVNSSGILNLVEKDWSLQALPELFIPSKNR